MKKLRIFISSPGDVQQERLIAKKVIAGLNRIYSQYVELETIMWEDLPLEATASFQDGINYFLEKAPIDIAVFILWSRLGSKLGQSFKKPDGSEYQSGTEYEFDMMYALWEQTKRPKIMVYVKDAEPQYTNLSLSGIQEALEQKNLLQNFIEENFRDRDTGTNYAYWQFDKQQTFEERLRTHLTRLIHEQIGENVHIKEWEGNPYVGLRSYEEAEASIFCGRQSLIYDIAEHWIQQTDTFTQKPLLILGESGSGKSSLIKAGLIPYLHNMSTEKQTYRVRSMIPSEFRGNVYQGIVKNLLEAFPDMENNPVAVDLTNGISTDYDFKYLRFALTNTSNDNITVFFFDQFEELFNDGLITEDEKGKTLQLLHGLCSMPHLWLIVSMRNDFYSKFTAYPEFGALKNMAYVVDVPNVSATDIAEIVEIPAKKANLIWEVNDHGISLSKKIIQEANELKDLPLIEFGLSELYNGKTGDKLTFAAYEEMGRLKGAVAKYANKCYEALTEKEKAGFEQLLGAVITVSSQDENKYVRKTSLIKDIAKTEQQKDLIKKLTDAHLFVTSKDANGESTITIVHEMLFSSWDIVKCWIEKQKDFIKKNNYYENLARVWDGNGRRDKDLVQERSQLLEAEYFMFNGENKTSSMVCDFLGKSLKRQSGRGLAKHLFFFMAFLFCLLGAVSLPWLKQEGYMMESEILNDLTEGAFSWDMIIFWITLIFISIHAIVLRIIRKPKYKTIKFTFVFTIVCFIIYFISALKDVSNVINDPDNYGWWALLWYVPLIAVGINVVTEYRRRNLWSKGIFKTYFFADRFYKIKDYIIWAFVALMALFVLLIYVLIINEKVEEKDEAIEKYESTLEVADELFEGLNNIQGRLSWSDRKYLNTMRLQYLADRFADEISDTIPDRREGQVAVCLYNLYKPIEAQKYLYPFRWWDHEILKIKCWMKSGWYELAEAYLVSYLEEPETDGSSKYLAQSYASTHDLIWIAEKLGRFDLAEQLYSLIKDNEEDIENDVALVMNYGHIQLMKGNINEALRYYKQSMNMGITSEWEQGAVEKQNKFIKSVIADDFSAFHWLDVGDKDMIRQAAKELDIHYKTDFYTSVADSVATDQIHERLVGTWALADSSLVIEVNDIMPLCLYKWFDENKNEKDRALTNCRFSIREDTIYWEEYDQDKVINSVLSGEITKLSDSSFSIRIIDNGNDSDKGKTRTYYKVSQTK
ncbi:MAG: hypothetical protein K5920_11555 [Bacteroidales bacterium]|nr:hypothetical protein [Bacteroidales bacterium]